MGSLDNRLFGGVGMLSALLFLVAGALILIGGDSVSVGSSSAALYVLTVSGIVAVVYSARMLLAKDSFVQTMCGIFILLAGAISAAAAFTGGSADTVVAVAGMVAAVAIITDMLTMWIGKVYGAMYISAVLAAIELFAAIMAFSKGAATYQGLVFIVFALWMIVSSAVTMFVNVQKATKTRMVVEDAVSQKASRPQAQNKKGTKKAKRPEPKEEPATRPAPKAPQSSATPKPVRKEDVAKPQPKPEAVPTVSSKAINEPVKPAEPVKKQEAPKPAAKPVETVKAEPKPAEKKPDFMSRLVSSKDASMATAKKEAPKPAPADDASKSTDSKPEAAGSTTEETARLGAVDTPEDAIRGEVELEPAIEIDEMSRPSEPPTPETVEEAISEEVGGCIEEDVPETDDPEPEAAPSEGAAEDDEAVSDEVNDAGQTPAGESSPKEDVPEETVDDDDEALGEDMFTDNSPEALVRRAAWNRGLRCRRGYGDHNIPVAFVKGKVAVFVDEPDADTSVDSTLESEGWTVLRFNASDVTDGKDQGEVIVAAVKSNIRSSKAASKKKKKPSKK